MLRVNFKIDKTHLAYRLWFSEFRRRRPRPQWVKLKREIWSQFDGSSALELFTPNRAFNAINPVALAGYQNISVLRDDADVRKILKFIKRSKAFVTELRNAKAYKLHVRAIWHTAETVIVSTLRTSTSERNLRDFTVLLLPPGIRIGSYLGNGFIEWGFPDLYPSYQAIGIAHELLHGITDKIARRSSNADKWLLHALIYLMADEGIRASLEGDHYKPFDPKVTRYYDKHLVVIAHKLYERNHLIVEKGAHANFAISRQLRMAKIKE